MTNTQIRETKQTPAADDTRLAALGDAAAFSRLILQYEGMLYRVCRTVLKNEADCADAVQETIITAWRRIGQLRNTASFAAWAARICMNHCYRLARRARRTEPDTGYRGREAMPDTRLDVFVAVSGLPRRLKLVIVFYYYEDWSVEQIAGALGLLRGTVKSRLYNARRLLAQQLKDYKEGNRHDAR